MLKKFLLTLPVCAIIAVVIVVLPVSTKEVPAAVWVEMPVAVAPVVAPDPFLLAGPCGPPNCGLGPGWTPKKCGAHMFGVCWALRGEAGCAWLGSQSCIQDCLYWCRQQEVECGYATWEVEECRLGCSETWWEICLGMTPASFTPQTLWGIRQTSLFFE